MPSPSSHAVHDLLAGTNSVDIDDAVIIWAPLPADAVAAACRKDGRLWVVIDDTKGLSRQHATAMLREHSDTLRMPAPGPADAGAHQWLRAV